jgi:hypothetical protein
MAETMLNKTGKGVLAIFICALLVTLTLSACQNSASSTSSPPKTYPNPLTCSGSAVPGLADHLLIGFAGQDGTASASEFDLRYQYLAGTVASDVTCTLCSNCNTGSNWWGCWQEMNREPGLFVQRFITAAEQHGLLPMFTYYIILHASGVQEGTPEVTAAATNRVFMTRYFNDYRFFLQQVGAHRAIIHIEPDFWGYAQQAARAASTDAHHLAAEVNTANATDCGSQENSIAGMGSCMIAMVRAYAPNAYVGLHASGWGSGYDVILNTDPTLSIGSQGVSTADFLLSCGAAQSDVIVADISDRDAGYYQSIGRNTWLDATDAKLPNFTQTFTWSRFLANRSGKPVLWWQVPVGNMGLSNTTNAWKDNKVDYFFAHPDRVTANGAIGMAFGSGASGQTTPETDNDNLVGWASALKEAGSQQLCR